MKSTGKGSGKTTSGKANSSIFAQPADDWQAQNDFETLTKAHEIKSDKKRHKAAIAHGKKKLKHIQRVTQGEYGAESSNTGATNGNGSGM